ncbi:hypothetical protein [Parasutterella sp.]|jgi:hypothetical protein|uniref:hypothetical protein n=1 Tax=Parasutterella TaxID=577310 RepID=UPI00206D963B|nr:MAG TPA: holin family protein [Caudoviricetes sp.]
MALKLTEKERKRLYYLEHKEEINKKGREYYATKVKPKRQKKGALPQGSQGPFAALFIGVEND